jgi:hypothetical protein
MNMPIEQPRDELKMQHDLIGLSFYGVSDAYKRKFITVHSHLQFDHHPIRKLMDYFRKWFEHFIKDKQLKIKQGLEIYSLEEHKPYLLHESRKLMCVIIDYLTEFVRILARATILYYQLDLKKGETTDICLHNLITSLCLKNPVYSQVMAVFKQAHTDQMQELNLHIERLRDRRGRLASALEISEW